MYESADRINTDLKQLFGSTPLESFNVKQREEILNIMIRFGAVAKFRCRSNVAYENFINACLKDISNTKKVELKDGYTIVQADMVKDEPNLFE